LGVAPFTLVLRFVGLPATTVLAFPIGVILAQAMPSILVYAQELFSGNLGLISGLFFGFAFGMGALDPLSLARLQIVRASSTSTGSQRFCRFLV
jgi:FSR family fosmidomycin resistance protein-like MFS transporter